MPAGRPSRRRAATGSRRRSTSARTSIDGDGNDAVFTYGSSSASSGTRSTTRAGRHGQGAVHGPPDGQRRLGPDQVPPRHDVGRTSCRPIAAIRSSSSATSPRPSRRLREPGQQHAPHPDRSRGPSMRIEVQAFHGLVNGKPWDVNNQAPDHALDRQPDFSNGNSGRGHRARPTPIVRARRDGPDDAVRRLRLVERALRLHGRRARGLHAVSRSGFALSGPVTVTFGDVLYHEGAPDELVCAYQTLPVHARAPVHRDQAALRRSRASRAASPRRPGTRRTSPARRTETAPARSSRSRVGGCTRLPRLRRGCARRRDAGAEARLAADAGGASADAADAATPTPSSRPASGPRSRPCLRPAARAAPRRHQPLRGRRRRGHARPGALLRSVVLRAAARHGQRRQPGDAGHGRADGARGLRGVPHSGERLLGYPLGPAAESPWARAGAGAARRRCSTSARPRS